LKVLEILEFFFQFSTTWKVLEMNIERALKVLEFDATGP